MVVTRIAPSPTGDPHVGTAYVGLFNYLVAKQNKGKFILRIEDTDRNRYVPESEHNIFGMMHWLGLNPDASPENTDAKGPYRQSERFDLYGEYAQKLLDTGHAYRAFETPEELEQLRKNTHQPLDIPSRYFSAQDSQAKADAGIPYTIRLKVPKDGTTVVNDRLRDPIEFQNKEIDDKVLLKTDGFPTYHLANVVDDHLMDVTHVIRAEEWVVSTPIHVMLYAAFGWQEPLWYHLPLLRNTDKTKLSKRKNHTSAKWYQEHGFLPEAMLNFLATMGFTHPEGKEIFDLHELERVFDIDKVHLGAPVFDAAKLRWYNAQYLRHVLSLDEVAERLHHHLQEKGKNIARDDHFKNVLRLMLPRIEILDEFWDKAVYFFEDTYPNTEKAEAALQNGKDILPEIVTALSVLPEFTPETISTAFKTLAEQKGLKLGKIMPPVRAATTGTMESPELPETLAVLGKEKVIQRLKKWI